MINILKRITGHSKANVSGWHTNRRIIIIESDDWGSTRMPSLEILNTLIQQKKVEFCLDTGFEKNDTIASLSDLENLFEVLSSVKDKNNNSAVITANCVVANPDFAKIKESDFSEYHYEWITDTMTKYYPQANPFNLWEQGMDSGLFYPQFHGREHLNVQLWLYLLRNNISGARDAFNETVYSQSFRVPNDNRTEVLSAYDYRNESERLFIKKSIHDGLNIFEELFGYRSVSAISPCYVWDDYVEKCYLDEGIKYIQGGLFQHYSTFQKKQFNKIGRYHYCGEKNKTGQYYLVRNCFFEPSQYENIDFIDQCLSKIKLAFFWKKPAIISAHRLNFIGVLNMNNRDKNLKSLAILLKEIVKRWPDIEFATSDKLFDMINKQD